VRQAPRGTVLERAQRADGVLGEIERDDRRAPSRQSPTPVVILEDHRGVLWGDPRTGRAPHVGAVRRRPRAVHAAGAAGVAKPARPAWGPGPARRDDLYARRSRQPDRAVSRDRVGDQRLRVRPPAAGAPRDDRSAPAPATEPRRTAPPSSPFPGARPPCRPPRRGHRPRAAGRTRRRGLERRLVAQQHRRRRTAGTSSASVAAGLVEARDALGVPARSRATVTSPHNTDAVPGSRSATARPGPLRASGVRGPFRDPHACDDVCIHRVGPDQEARSRSLRGKSRRRSGSVGPRARRSRPRRRGRAPYTGADRS
jgi:hypothetical protein